MRLSGVIVFQVWVCLYSLHSVSAQAEEDKFTYRALRYSHVADYAVSREITAEYDMALYSDGPDSIYAQLYFIKYGDDTLIDITEPASGTELLGVVINHWDFVKGRRTSTHYMEYARRYRTSTDTILFDRDSSAGVTTPLCLASVLDQPCDTLKWVRTSDSLEITVYLNTGMTNLPGRKLLYPDIRFLPVKMETSGPPYNRMTLEEIYEGKAAVDALLQQFSYDGYREISLDELEAIDPEPLLEFHEFFLMEMKSRRR